MTVIHPIYSDRKSVRTENLAVLLFRQCPLSFHGNPGYFSLKMRTSQIIYLVNLQVLSFDQSLTGGLQATVIEKTVHQWSDDR